MVIYVVRIIKDIIQSYGIHASWLQCLKYFLGGGEGVPGEKINIQSI